MDKPIHSEKNKKFFSNPQIVEHYPLLENIGVFTHIDSLDQEITNYRNLFSGALDIVNCTSIGDIIDAAVWQISDNFLPASIVFLWKPLQNREDINIRCYKNYQLVDINFWVDTISIFEPFFKKHSEPVNFSFFASEMGQSKTIQSFNALAPELVIPILGPMGLYGLVLVGRNILGNEYTKLELLYLQNLMSFVSKAIQSHLHYERTLRDPKTGLYNNNFFMTRLTEEIGRTRRTQSETSIIMMDVDYFKNFNNFYGHLAGDRVLETLAITIKQGVRLGDVPSRFGGEEFTVLLPDTGNTIALTVAERLRTMVEEMKVVWEPPLPKVTISIGIYTFDKTATIAADEMIHRADLALYLSKAKGRNRTTEWNENIENIINHLKVPYTEGFE